MCLSWSVKAKLTRFLREKVTSYEKIVVSFGEIRCTILMDHEYIGFA